MKARISEIFYSVQGEGTFSGVPSVFVRFAGCNLCCGGKDAALLKKGKAKFWCDTEPVWRKGEEMTVHEVAQKILDVVSAHMLAPPGAHALNLLQAGRVHIVLTGGEPAMNWPFITALMDDIMNTYGSGYFYEMETNGTLHHPAMRNVLNHITWSPKLSNSGMKQTAAHKASFDYFAAACSHRAASICVKFVINDDEDVHEAMSFARLYAIPFANIMFMPAVSKREHLAETTRRVFEYAKQCGVRACTRLHVLAWDEVTGV